MRYCLSLRSWLEILAMREILVEILVEILFVKAEIFYGKAEILAF